MKNKISVVIFSFNRGEYVKNCFESVVKCMPDADILIYDDNSDDASTVFYLKSLGSQVKYQCFSEENRHGGLYKNMQTALENTNTEFILFLQDDTQLVRPFDSLDMNVIENFFEKNPDAAFINPVFLKGHRRKSIDKQVFYQEGLEGYYHVISERIKPRPVSMYYCDVVLAKVSSLKCAGWRFLDTETKNAEMARSHYSKMLQMANPFVMHLPEVPVFRGRKRTYAARLAAYIVGDNIKKFLFLSPEKVKEMKNRNLIIAPYAEDFLETEDHRVAKPYSYNAVSTRLYLRILHKLEYGILKLIKVKV